jgi:prepilin-type N-terminal cleavage/methylation domain-containing protein
MVKPAGGFSLIELMVVVAILGIMLGFAAPYYAEWVATQRVRDTAADIHTSPVEGSVYQHLRREWQSGKRMVHPQSQSQG